MKFWSDDRLRWYQDAASQSDFHQKLATFIRPYLKPSDTVLDLGCGLGYLMDELKDPVRAVYGADMDERALKLLQARQPDIPTYWINFPEELPPPADVLITMFFGRNLIEHEAFEKLYRRLHIVIRNRSTCTLEVPEQRELNRRTDQDMVAYAREHGLRYEHHLLDLSFDQPLRSREDALRYAMNYRPTNNPAHYDDYLAQHLKTNPNPAFPFIIRKKKELGIVIIYKETP